MSAFDFLTDDSLTFEEQGEMLKAIFTRQLEKPNEKPQTSREISDRADRLRSYAHQAKRAGIPVHDIYLETE